MMGDLFYRFGTALAIGLLIGLEREFRHTQDSKEGLFAGIRTFPMFAITGCAAAMLAELLGSPWGLLVPLIIVGGLVTAAYVVSARDGFVGMTTEITAVLMVIVGALCFYDQVLLAVAMGVAVLLLLSAKMELHRFSQMLTREEFLAIARFGIITAVVLPLLPDDSIAPAPFDVLTPRNVWLMVVLVAGLSFVGYGLKKFVGHRKAIALTGLLGGLVSSTAVTLTFTQRSSERSDLSVAFAIAILIAWITMFIRVVVEVAIVNRNLVAQLWIPMTAAAAAGTVYCLLLRRKQVVTDASEDVEVKNPFSLSKAVTFGALYAVVLVIARVAQMYFGDKGIYFSAIAAGFTDVDAITLSMAELSQEGGTVDAAVAVRAITLAAVSNTLVKAGMVFAIGHKLLKQAVLPGFLLIVVAALAAAFLL